MEFPDSAAPRPARCGAVDLCKALSICAVVLIHCSANSLAYLPVGSGEPRCGAVPPGGRCRPFSCAAEH